MLQKGQNGIFKTPNTWKCWEVQQEIKHLHAPIILPKLSTEDVQTSMHGNYIFYSDMITLPRDMPKHIVPPNQSQQKFPINLLGKPKWKNQNYFEFQREVSSLIMIKFNSRQIWLQFDRLQKFPYST